MKQIKAWVASAPKSKFVQQEIDLVRSGTKKSKWLPVLHFSDIKFS
jgi:hypothetical protein